MLKRFTYVYIESFFSPVKRWRLNAGNAGKQVPFQHRTRLGSSLVLSWNGQYYAHVTLESSDWHHFKLNGPTHMAILRQNNALPTSFTSNHAIICGIALVKPKGWFIGLHGAYIPNYKGNIATDIALPCFAPFPAISRVFLFLGIRTQ